MSDIESSYQRACQQVRQTALLQSSLALLEWDQQTYLPPQAAEYRSQQIAHLAELIHQQQTAPELGEWLDELAGADSASDPASDFGAMVLRMREDFDRQRKLPADLVAALAKATSMGQHTWVAARKDNDFASFAPSLEELLRLKQEQADALGYEETRYDALLEEYEPGARTAEVSQVLDSLCQELVPMVAELADHSDPPDPQLLHRNYPIAAQETFAREASEAIGFNYQQGRLDIAAHPFCTELGPRDCRITTRFDDHFFSSAFFGTLHEAGHGLYEQGLPESQYGLPLGRYASLGIHESQSRLWENFVGRRASFWDHFYPRAQALFPDALGNTSQHDFYRAINRVAPSLIRVEADEVTYNLHIAIRFELERDLIGGQLTVPDLPGAWDQKYQDYLGIQPDSDANGVLQDVHWSAGLFGYFPTYALGNLYAAQFYATAERDLGDLDADFSAGKFTSLRNWLVDRVHVQGRRWTGPQLGEHVTGEKLGSSHLVSYLKEKLARVYG